MDRSKLLRGVAESASYNIFLQILFRIQTFVLNGFILRFISKDVLGIINVRLLLLYSTITFLSTEAFKNACIANPENQNWKQIINLLWFAAPAAAICSFVLGYIWLFVIGQPDNSLSHQYFIAVCTIGFCCVLERLAEPLYVVTQIFLLNKLKVLLQCFTIAAQSGIFAAIVYFYPDKAIIGFCLGQAVRSVLWITILYGYFILYFKKSHMGYFKSIKDFMPSMSISEEQPPLSRDHVALTLSFFKQGILKQILTEGERYMMTLFNLLDFANQGIFDVVSNLGSLAARFIFRPIEESGYQFFAQSLERNKSSLEQNQTSVKLAAQVLTSLLKIMILISFIILAFGYSYSYLLLNLYGGNLLSSGIGPTLLRWHCVYVLTIAINGITEGFAFAMMNKADIDQFNIFMIYISIAFLALAWYLTPIFGGVGLILANCANMLLRIIHSIHFILKYFKPTGHQPLWGLLLHPGLFMVLFGSAVATAYSERLFCCNQYHSILVHIGIGSVCLIAVVITTVFTEKELVHFIIQIFQRHHTDEHKKE